DSLSARLDFARAYHGPPMSQVRRWAPVVAWAAVIFALSSIPHLSTGLGLWDTILRKGAHTAEYAILGALLLRALGSIRSAFALRLHYARSGDGHQRCVRRRH